MAKKNKRQTASMSTRIYPDTHEMLKDLASGPGKFVATEIHEAVKERWEKWKKK